MAWADVYRKDPRWGDAVWLLTHTDNPLVVLRALTDARTLTDTMLVHAVNDARTQGATWEQVADALRVTRQAAHSRFAPNHEKVTGGLDAPLDPPTHAEPPSD